MSQCISAPLNAHWHPNLHCEEELAKLFFTASVSVAACMNDQQTVSGHPGICHHDVVSVDCSRWSGVLADGPTQRDAPRSLAGGKA